MELGLKAIYGTVFGPKLHNGRAEAQKGDYLDLQSAQKNGPISKKRGCIGNIGSMILGLYGLYSAEFCHIGSIIWACFGGPDTQEP